MADIRRGIGADNRVERLPWLEPVEDEGEPSTTRRWAVLGLGALALVAIAIAAAVTVARWNAAHADIGGIIRAPAGPYKVKPAQAGGLASATADRVAEQTGTGADVDAPLALVGAEQPVVGPGAQGAAPDANGAGPRPAPTARAAMVLPDPKPAAAATPPAAGAPPMPASAPATGGGTVQLGAFGSEAKAKTAWKNLSKRFSYLAPLNVSILPAQVNDATVYRLRAGGGEPAARICARLQLAGEACAVIG